MLLLWIDHITRAQIHDWPTARWRIVGEAESLAWPQWPGNGLRVSILASLCGRAERPGLYYGGHDGHRYVIRLKLIAS